MELYEVQFVHEDKIKRRIEVITSLRSPKTNNKNQDFVGIWISFSLEIPCTNILEPIFFYM